MLTVFTQMRSMLRAVGGHFGGERGQDLIEYALLTGIIAAAIVGVAAAVLSGAVSDLVNGIADCIDWDNTTDCNSPL